MSSVVWVLVTCIGGATMLSPPMPDLASCEQLSVRISKAVPESKNVCVKSEHVAPQPAKPTGRLV